ncbi:hypothetical protein J2X01_000332 [Arthrobacter ginsengisoli]|uniref:Glycogen debranching enzyme GlgX n=1 Tax=Arthrobacter ginsengisoli TaxID=1356565 RepID=A0ABU1U797_9MICC|nr:hypothetical protein [Arthrobacter ginsengisoli]MDR7081063.1 hypothetical protein [Arthrobacter ginsengisoli]
MITCVLAQGVPMLRHGDELGHSQSGNNNAYCQDNGMSWIDWASADKDMIEFTSKLVRLRRDYPVFRRRTFFDGRPVAPAEGARLPDIFWLNAAGTNPNSGAAGPVLVKVPGLQPERQGRADPPARTRTRLSHRFQRVLEGCAAPSAKGVLSRGVGSRADKLGRPGPDKVSRRHRL